MRDPSAQAQAAAFQQLVAAQAQLQAPGAAQAAAPAQRGAYQQQASRSVLPITALEAMLRHAPAEARRRPSLLGCSELST